MIAAPQLLEVAQIWWDVERVPYVVWDDAACIFELVDPADMQLRLRLARFSGPVTDPAQIAVALAQGLAACDFPPNGDGVESERARVTLRAAGIDAWPTC